MVDSKNFTIGVLSVTAVILFLGVILLNELPTAYAIGQTDKGGDYVVSTAQYSNSMEVVFILDAAASKIIAYGYDMNRKRLEQIAGFDLAHLQEELRNRTDGKRRN
jgi:hypothetical protein